MWENTTKSDCGANKSIEFFITTDGKLKVAGSNALDFEILGSVLQKISMCEEFGIGRDYDERKMTHSCKLEYFCGEVFEDCGNIDGCLSSNSHLVLGVVLQETLDTSARKL
jgi:hypothetical protein